MSRTPFATTYTCTDGKQFDNLADARRHQVKIGATNALATKVAEATGIEFAVAVNIMVVLSENPEELVKLIGRTIRTPKAGADASADSGDPTPTQE